MSIEDFNAQWPDLFRQLCSPLTSQLDRVRAADRALVLIEKSGLGPSAWILFAMINECLRAGGWPPDIGHYRDACSIVGEQLATELQLAYEQLMSDGDTGGLVEK